MKNYLPLLGSFIIWAVCCSKPAVAQKKLDSIVHYTYSSSGQDSLAIGKTMFDYNSSKQLVAKRTLTTSNFVQWTNELRSEFVYDGQGRLLRTNKDSFMAGTSTWKTFKYSERSYQNDSQYTIRFYELQGTGFLETLTRKRISLFTDGSVKSRTTMAYDETAVRWVLKEQDSLVKNYSNGSVVQRHETFPFRGAQVSHFSGPDNDFFRLDSIQIGNTTYKKYSGAPANTVVYRTRRRSGLKHPYFTTSDSSIYYLNSNGLPDSMHKYTVSFGSPQYTRIGKKEFFTWDKQTQTSWSEGYLNGGQFYLFTKNDYNRSENGTLFDTIPYLRGGSGLEKTTKTSTKFNKDGTLQYIAQYRWSTIVDSFSIDEKQHYFYSDVFTSLKPANNLAAMEVWPNPSSGSFWYKGSQGHTLEVLNLQGKVVLVLDTSNSNSFQIAEKGAYLLRNRETGQVTKLVIQ